MLVRLGFFFLRGLLRLRYRIVIKGAEKLNTRYLNRKGGILFLPNHPAHVDPVILTAFLWPKVPMRPLVIEYVYRLRGVHLLMKLIKALPIPNFESSFNELKLKQAEKSLEIIKQGLSRREAFLLYPSGRIKYEADEIIGGASSTHDLLANASDTNIVLIRTSGLWGSIFSRALTGKSPNIEKNLVKSLGIILKNLIFFIPRRKVLLEIEVNPKDFPWKASRLDLNRYLENWYNQYPFEEKRIEKEPLTLISHHFLYRDYPERISLSEKKEKGKAKQVPEEIRREVYKELAELSQKDPSEIQDTHNLAMDLGLDSLNLAHLITFLADHYSIKEVFPEQLQTVHDVLQTAVGAKESFREEEESEIDGWPREKQRPPAEAPFGKTLQESFLRSCDRMKSQLAIADEVSGVLTYQKLKLNVLALAEHCKKLPGSHVAIMLPASVGAYVSILAVLFAGKIPVMLNWTLGAKFLNDTLQLTSAKTVISSWRFLERLSYVEFGEMTSKIRFLEDIRKKISLGAKLKALFLSKLRFKSLLRISKLHKIHEDDTAGILFTSGTETVPKGVPLSHKNLLSDLNAAMQCVRLQGQDILLGILPPFHSFGFSVAGLFPILAGVRVAFSPDPTDSFALVKAIKKWRATVICSAPSFLKGVLHAGTKKDLRSLRLFVTGAEKTSEELYKKVASLGPGKKIVEGYGITECAPILTLNRPNLPPKGVGQPIPGVECCIIHPETKALLSNQEEGEICVRGPNVFNGYLGNVASPFIQIEGKRWYRTGDLGHFDEKGNLLLSGRLKRFTKLGGEMISLGGVEEVLNTSFPSSDEKYSFAVCAQEGEQGAILVVFTTQVKEEKEMNKALKEAGYSRLVKVHKVVQLDEIPITGTGKVDYRRLQGMLEMGKA